MTGIDTDTSTAACPLSTRKINILIMSMKSLMIIALIQTEPCILQAPTQISEQANSTYILMKLASMLIIVVKNNSNSNIISSLVCNVRIVLMSNKRLGWIRYFRKRG